MTHTPADAALWRYAWYRIERELRWWLARYLWVRQI